ncbi:MAG: class I SAM-dependent methyltransferase [Desulforhopalus sp.]
MLLIDPVVNPEKIKKGKTRWNQCVQKVEELDAQILEGPVLDFGSGIGYFVLEGLRRGFDIWGVDRDMSKLERYRMLIELTSSPANWSKRCLIANGRTLPFPSRCFSLVTSWWVLEHIAAPLEVIREMVRVTRIGGVVVVRAQDARSGWEGHCKIPWIPYLSGQQARYWIEEFGESPLMYENVYNITQPEVIDSLEELGCRILSRDDTPPPIPFGSLVVDNCTESEIRRLARQKKREYDQGIWRPKPDGLYLYAQKVAS